MRVLGDGELILCGVPGTYRGEAQPLTIRNPELTIKQISQNSTFPGDTNNMITVSLQSNSRLSSCQITIRGMPSSVGAGSIPLLPLVNSSQESVDIFIAGGTSGQALLDNGDVILNIKQLSSIDPYATYSFSFAIRNPNFEQNPPALSITACGVIPMQTMSSPGGPIPGLQGSMPGDARVLKVHGPAFILKEIVQSSPWPNSYNNLTISLATNVDLHSRPGLPKSKITLSGFTDTQTASADNLPLIFASALSPFQGTAKWTKKAAGVVGSLVLTIREGSVLQAGVTSVASFQVKNWMRRQIDPALVMIESDYYMADSNSKQNIDKMSMDVRQDLVPEVLMAEPGDALPLLTHAPAFMLRRMGQRTANPGAQNTLTVTLAANVNLQGDSITIRGLGALSGSVALESCNCKQADEVEGVDLFTLDASDTNRIRLTFEQSIALAKGIKIVFALGVTNPDTGVGLDSPNQITVEFPFVEAGPFVKAGGDAAPLKILARAFTLKHIGQSTPYPNVQNTIEVTLATNTPLPADSIIRISNLAGVSAPTWSTDPMFDPSWNPTAEELDLTIKSGQQLAPGNTKTWSFQITNPAEPNVAPSVSVEVLRQGSLTIAKSVMTRTGGELQKVLNILNLAFETFVAQQSEALPIAINNISFTLSTTESLPEGARITIAGPPACLPFPVVVSQLRVFPAISCDIHV